VGPGWVAFREEDRLLGGERPGELQQDPLTSSDPVSRAQIRLIRTHFLEHSKLEFPGLGADGAQQLWGYARRRRQAGMSHQWVLSQERIQRAIDH